MLKRFLLIMLAALMVFSVTGCRLIGKLFNKKPSTDVNTENPNNLDLEDYSDNGDVSGFWEHLYEEWKNSEEKGYVWTITIDEATVIDALGLAKVNYDLDLSVSHVGEDMFGVYRGSMAMSYDADTSGVSQLLGTLMNGKTQGKTDGWFRNDRFIMELTPFNKEKEDAFISTLEPEKTGEEGEADYSAAAAALIALMGNNNKIFEDTSTPAAYWFDWDYHMTSGDMSSYYSVSGSFYGVSYSADGSMDASGSHISGSGVAHSYLIGQTFTERYSEDFESPFPYVIRVYETGEVVFELHSATGGPVVVKFYGTIDKVPVEATQTVPGN